MAATARILNHPGVNWTLRSTGFEAANFGLLSGSEALQKAASKRLIDEALAIRRQNDHHAGVRPRLSGAALERPARQRRSAAFRGAGCFRVCRQGSAKRTAAAAAGRCQQDNRATSFRHKAWGIKLEQIEATGANTVVVSCAGCRLNFMAAAERDQWPTRIASLVELVAEQLPKGKEL